VSSLTQSPKPKTATAISRVLEESDATIDAEWDSFLADLGSNHHLQSSLWSQVKSANGWKSRRVVALQCGQIVGGAQLLIRKIRLVGSVGYLPKGPILVNDDADLAQELILRIRQIASRERIKVLFIQPPQYGCLSEQLVQQGFRPSPVETAPAATLLVDLTSELDTILSRMPKGMRNQIRRSQNRGITVREGNQDDLPIFHQLLTSTSQRRGFSTFDLKYFQTMWDLFAPSGGMKLFLAELGNEPVSAQFCIAFGDTVIAKQIGWSGLHGKLHPNEALDWNTIRWAKENGYKFYDLEGIENPAAQAILDGDPLPMEYANSPTSYKLRLGGEVRINPGAYCFVSNPLLRSIYNRVGFQVANWPIIHKAASRFRTG
jgi:lipid II:glycine glycyltransferase (peptidoglycan interpeptide bridge formation enzyme)